ncbi:MAG: LLM class flavin-dependent oxidoreductase [Myxococcota bacterium]
MRFAVEVWSDRWEAIERTARLVERLRYDALYYGESPTGLNLDCWSVLAALARSTRSLRLGPVITNLLPGYRSLALLAKQAATVAILTGGRLDFRTGAGAARRYAACWWEPFGIGYPDYGERLALVDRAMPLLRALWAGEPTTLAGGGAQESVTLGFRPPPIPITLAASGRAGIACAARHADVWEASYRTPAEFAELSARFAAEPVGARPAVVRALEVDVFIGMDAARAGAVLSRVREERPPEQVDHVVERSLHGTPEQVAAQLAGLAEVGVEQLLLAFHDPHDAEALEAFAEAMDVFASASRRGSGTG